MDSEYDRSVPRASRCSTQRQRQTRTLIGWGHCRGWLGLRGSEPPIRVSTEGGKGGYEYCYFRGICAIILRDVEVLVRRRRNQKSFVGQCVAQEPRSRFWPPKPCAA